VGKRHTTRRTELVSLGGVHVKLLLICRKK
jgi:hypothetical protein